MNSRLFRALLAVLLMFVALEAMAQPVQTTAFTYQGQLNAGGTLPTGTYQFTFTLYDAASGGSQVVGIVPIQMSIQVINGLFTADLDFGRIFTGRQFWLEVKVGTTVANEETLSARQPINAVPVAQYALDSAPRDFADYFALMPPDNAVPVSFGANVRFPQDGPSSGTDGIVRAGSGQFRLKAVGTYQVMFQVSVSEARQLVIVLNGIELPETMVGRATGNTQLVGTALVETTAAESILGIRNPFSGMSPLTITPFAGGSLPVSAHLVITRLR